MSDPGIVLKKRADRYQFAQWVRLWLRERRRSRGDSILTLLEDGLEIRNSASMAFAPTDVVDCVPGNGGRDRLTVNFMGLTGAVSPLPSYFLDGLSRGRESHAPLKAMLDMFDGRIYALQAQGMLLRRPGVRAELGEADGLHASLLSFAGRSDAAGQARELSHWAALGSRNRSKEGLRTYLATVLGIASIQVDDLRVERIPNPAPCRLGEATLAGSAAIGEFVQVAGSTVAVVLGPLSLAQYRRVASRKERYQEALGRIFSDYLACEWKWTVQATLSHSEMLPEEGCRLGDKDAPGLGRLAWLGSRNEGHYMSFESR